MLLGWCSVASTRGCGGLALTRMPRELSNRRHMKKLWCLGSDSYFFLAALMEQFGGGRVFCRGAVKLSFPEGLHHEQNFSRHELSCLLVLTTILAMLES